MLRRFMGAVAMIAMMVTFAVAGKRGRVVPVSPPGVLRQLTMSEIVSPVPLSKRSRPILTLPATHSERIDMLRKLKPKTSASSVNGVRQVLWYALLEVAREEAQELESTGHAERAAQWHRYIREEESARSARINADRTRYYNSRVAPALAEKRQNQCVLPGRPSTSVSTYGGSSSSRADSGSAWIGPDEVSTPAKRLKQTKLGEVTQLAGDLHGDSDFEEAVRRSLLDSRGSLPAHTSDEAVEISSENSEEPQKFEPWHLQRAKCCL